MLWAILVSGPWTWEMPSLVGRLWTLYIPSWWACFGLFTFQAGGHALDSLHSKLVGRLWALYVPSLVGILWTRGMRCKKSPKTRAGCFGLFHWLLWPRAFLQFFHRTPAPPKLTKLGWRSFEYRRANTGYRRLIAQATKYRTPKPKD